MFRHRATRSVKESRRTHLHLEKLETRTLLAFNVLQIQHAYGFDATTLYDGSGNPYAADGSGQTIAIVIWYDDPNIESDLQHFDAVYGLPDPPSFQKAFPQGQPQASISNGVEISLDVEYAHAMAPGASILLVEARTSSTSNLYGAIDYARNYPGVSVLSMSWGSLDSSSDRSLDAHFNTPDGHNGVSFVAASGDTGGVLSYPGDSPNVVGVGGTNLSLYSNGDYRSESGAGFSGGGASNYESEPDYQYGVQGSDKRQAPDVSVIASNALIYDTYGHSGFMSVSGTSVGTPIWAGLTAVMDEQMNLYGYDTLDGRSQLLPSLYGLAVNNNYPYYDGQDFHDIQTGGSRSFPAGLGYDESTGLGSPIVYNLVPDLVGSLTGIYPPPPQLRQNRSSSSALVDGSGSASTNGNAVSIPLLVAAETGTDLTSALATAPPGPGTSPAAVLTSHPSDSTAAVPVDQGTAPRPSSPGVAPLTATARGPVAEDAALTSGIDLSTSALNGAVLLE